MTGEKIKPAGVAHQNVRLADDLCGTEIARCEPHDHQWSEHAAELGRSLLLNEEQAKELPQYRDDEHGSAEG